MHTEPITAVEPLTLKNLASGASFKTFVLNDAQGQEIERLGYNGEGHLTYRTIRFREPTADGFTIREWTFDAGGSVMHRSEYQSDWQDNCTSSITYAADGRILDRQEYLYDDVEDSLTHTRWNADGQIIEHWKRCGLSTM